MNFKNKGLNQSYIDMMLDMPKLTQISESLFSTNTAMNVIKQYDQLTTSVSAAINASTQIDCQRFSQMKHLARILDDEKKYSLHIGTARSQLLQQAWGNQAIQKMFNDQSDFFDSLSIRVAAMGFDKINSQLIAQSELALEITSTRLADKMNNVGLMTQRNMLSARLFEVPNVYSEFVRQTTEKLANNQLPDIASRLRSSLNLAEHQMLGIADITSTFIVMPEDDDEPEDKRILNAPLIQQQELLCYSGNTQDENDIKSLVAISSTAQTEQKARRVLGLIVLSNKAGKMSENGEEFFKPTTCMMTVFADLPWISATDKWSMADVIDCLYFIFYEGAGKDKLRFIDEYGGPLTTNDCDLIFCIKHLRNKWGRHDIDHGSDNDIRKSWAVLSKQFQWLGLTSYPMNIQHYQLIHYKLLELAESFLLCMLNKLELKKAS